MLLFRIVLMSRKIIFIKQHALLLLDQLTGIRHLPANYKLAPVQIERAQLYQHPFTVAFIDLDEFKLVNGHLGRTAGDAALRTVARTISAVTPASDVAARGAGAEFVALFPDTGTAPARLAIEWVPTAAAASSPDPG